LPAEVVGQIAGLGEEILERRTLDLFHVAGTAETRIEILLKERAKIDLVEGVFLFRGGERRFFLLRGGGGGAIALFLAAAHVIEQRNRVLEFFEDRVLDHFGRNHVLKLELVQREHGDHLDKARRQDLPLRQSDVQLVLQQHHTIRPLPKTLHSQPSMRDWL